MKKLRIAVSMIVLTFSFSVHAKVLFKINCDSDTITDDNLVTCIGKLSYDQEGINDIEFDYQTNLNINLIAASGFTMTKLDNKVLIHANKTLFDVITNSTKIIEFTLSNRDNLSNTEDLIVNNIKVNNNDSIMINSVTKTFEVSSKKELEDICTLDSITIDNELIKDFDKEKLEYYVTTEKEIVFIDMVRTSNKSNVIGLGNVMVLPGETIERDIVVTAENKQEKTYKLFITNTMILEKTEKAKEEQVKSSDNTLKTLELYGNNTKIDFNFDNTSEIFNVDVLDIQTLTIKARLNDDKAAFVKGYGPRDILLNNGYNKILIKVLAENNNEKIITLNINYQDTLFDNNELESLIINDRVLDLNDKLEIVLPNDIDKTNIKATPKNNKAIVKYEDTNLIVGDNKIIVEVISVSGISKIYDINVIREDKEILLSDIPVKETTVIINKDNGLINIICYSIFIIGITVFISSIIYFNKKKKTL